MKVTVPVTFGFSRQRKPLLSGSHYLRVAITLGLLETDFKVTVVSDKTEAQHMKLKT